MGDNTELTPEEIFQESVKLVREANEEKRLADYHYDLYIKHRGNSDDLVDQLRDLNQVFEQKISRQAADEDTV